jgi:hypothetical protein
LEETLVAVRLYRRRVRLVAFWRSNHGSAELARAIPADTFPLPVTQPFMDIDDARAIAQAIVDTIRGPLLVFDKDLRVVTQTVQ